MSTLKKVLIALPVMILLALGVALAQMGSGGHDHGESRDHIGAMNSDQMNMMGGMSQRHAQMMASFDVLEQHFQDMMEVSNLQILLQDRMAEHQALMHQMRNHMLAQQDAWQQMMSSTSHSQPSPNEMTRTGTDLDTGSRTSCGH